MKQPPQEFYDCLKKLGIRLGEDQSNAVIYDNPISNFNPTTEDCERVRTDTYHIHNDAEYLNNPTNMKYLEPKTNH